ncbi:MAG: hypothetical protein A2Y40_04015 [Candidatus Margulisbacteria bacterium GWF2_35_9]|nr:MAG: hypothetical protein A2Y40_04015 [Candidatus Margulisbacteria bacterium GWF2_35_9]
MLKYLFRIIFILFVFPIYLFTAEAYISVNTEGLYSTTDKKIIHFINENKITGLSVAVIKGNKLLWANSYGWENMSEKIPLGSQTFFRIASVSKIVTLTAIMQLYEKGAFKLDDDVSQYLGFSLRNPKHPNTPITFEQLINHRSGLIEYMGNYSAFLESTYRNISNTQLKDILSVNGNFYSKNLWTEYAPGTNYIYSNLAYGILATIVERLTNIRFDEYCRRFIFNTLSMRASFNLSEINSPFTMANLYRSTNDASNFEVSLSDNTNPVSASYYNYYNSGSNACFFSPHGGLRSNAIDLAPLMIAYMNGGMHQDKRLIETSTLNLIGNKSLGLNITSKLINNKVFWGHSGSAYGLISHFFFSPTDKFGMIFIISGTNNYEVDGDFFKVEKAFSKLLYNTFM